MADMEGLRVGRVAGSMIGGMARTLRTGITKKEHEEYHELLKTLELLASQPPVLDYYRNRFDYILVDDPSPGESTGNPRGRMRPASK